MDFEEFLPEDVNEAEEADESDSLIEGMEDEVGEKIGQTQLYDIITSRKPDWQSIIYELINSEQLDPWDIDIVVLTNAYFKKILELDETENASPDTEESEGPDFYVSSKVLLAAALLLRIKSEFLLNKHIRSIDEILFGKKEENKYVLERIEINENELPILVPKTPMSRLRKVTLNELMSALNKAIETESRRIRKEVQVKRAKKLSEVDFPTFRRIDLKDRIKQFYARILTSLKKKQNENKSNKNDECTGDPKNRIGYLDLVGAEREEKLACFLPLLHLSNNQKLWLEQENHLDEIWIYLYDYFNKNKELFIEVLEEIEQEFIDEKENMSEDKSVNDNEIENEKSALDKAREKLENKRKLAEEARKELEKELGWDLGKIETEEKIDKITGFSEELE